MIKFIIYTLLLPIFTNSLNFSVFCNCMLSFLVLHFILNKCSNCILIKYQSKIFFKCLGVFDGYLCAEKDYRIAIHTVNWFLSFETWTSFVGLILDGKSFSCDDVTLMWNTFQNLGITRNGNENFIVWILSRKYLVSGDSVDDCDFEWYDLLTGVFSSEHHLIAGKW